ncbi:monosaccharide ABC transporter substrate-binding protein, CUT2 family [Arthrobacter crystallopoietes]|uniref:Monosaccharide ABC transporter substrate-binding protein, CUT2 family n=2 Tax=Crystallibacter crystallopoietes TaxID=37928 RepID=A0A1H1HY08_9MICC|nr:sugar ABC transporter substrate-binding protein [Arthrobacter crystallopoietes]AUI53845.1 sugar ABC transporter substrate-binding protein [Arthrobacter crystallopoietes]SDR30179.1 monosaccharide ABC transporter substrate-binding protein, CUT2 family [Arthrobacter crystallopoietes]
MNGRMRKLVALAPAAGMLLVAGCAPVEIAAEPVTGASWKVPALLTDCDAPDIEAAGCMGPNAPGSYESLDRNSVDEDWRICSVLPHLKDQTWIGMNYGQVNQAQQLDVSLTTTDAGGYENLADQVTQVEDCISSGADAILLSAVSNESLNPAIAAAKRQGIKVIDVGNGVSSTEVDARVLQDYYDMGKLIGDHMATLDEPMKVALLPGPAGAGWTERTRLGFEAATKDSGIAVADIKYGDTGKEVQLKLVEDVLSANPEIDAIVGTAITMEVAATVLAEQGKTGDVRLYGTYVTPQSVELIDKGRANCAPSEQSSRIGKMSVDLAVRVLQDIPLNPDIERYAPEPLVICGPREDGYQNIESFDATGSFAPEGWDPVFDVKGSSK